MFSNVSRCFYFPQAGFPFFQLDRFLKILVQDLNRYVAIAEEFPNNAADKVKSGGLMHDRRVARIITPGTLIDENFIDPYANNYVMAIHVTQPHNQREQGQGREQEQEHGQGQQQQEEDSRTPAEIEPEPEPRGIISDPGQVALTPDLRGADLPLSAPNGERLSLGLAWLDLSTGHFFTQSTNLSSLSSILSRVGPREVILDKNLQSSEDHDIFTTLAEDRYVITYASQGDRRLELDEWAPMLESELPRDARDAFTEGEVSAGSLLLRYVKDRLQGMSMKLQPPLRHENMHIMSIDKNTLRALEIKQTIRDGFFRGSLLHAIRRTVTKSGARLLNEWLSMQTKSNYLFSSRGWSRLYFSSSS